MNNLIERYVFAVTSRLPEKEREDVGRELRANIYDMLDDDADPKAVTSVLEGLGAPELLAEKYRQNPRYLISPRMYDEYIRALKWVLPLVGGLLFTIGLVLGLIAPLSNDVYNLMQGIQGGLAKGFGLGISGTMQALIWVTIGFVIAQRTQSNQAEERWSIQSLPQLPPSTNDAIPLSDSLIELALTVVFSIIGILVCTGHLRLFFAMQITSEHAVTQINSFFSPEFLQSSVVALVIIGLLGAGESVVKIIKRRWSPLVCGAVIANSLLGASIALVLISRPTLLSEELLSVIHTSPWGNLASIQLGGMQFSVEQLIPLVLGLIVVLAALVSIGTAIFKTLRAKSTASQAA